MSEAVAIDEKKQNDDKPRSYITHNISHRVTSEDEIRAFLKRLHKSHSLLNISLGEPSFQYGSVILEINHEKDYLVLDELYPKNDISTELIDKTLSIETQLEGILIQFEVTVQAISEKDSSEYYKVEIPKHVYYHQQRENYRVAVSLSNPLPADLATQNDVLIHAELRDISLGGLCARLTSQTGERLRVGDEIPTCIIQIPGGKKIVSSLEIVRVEETEPFKNTRIGARFTNLSHADEQELSRMIAKLERENIKTLKRR